MGTLIDAMRYQCYFLFMQVASSTKLYQYRSASQFLLDYVCEQQRTNRDFSIRGWAREMGMATHTSLVMVLQGKRRVSVKQIPFFARGLGLTPQDQIFFQGLIQYENANSEAEKEQAKEWLEQHVPCEELHEVTQFWMISSWIHMAILEITALKSFKGTAADIKKRLRASFTSQEIQQAIHNLKSHKLLKEVEGRLVRTTVGVTTKNGIPDRGVREYHKQVLALASKSIDEQTSLEREFQSFAMAIDVSKVPLAKSMVREFKSQLCKVLKTDAANEVYQFNFNFFSLTQESNK